jgi:hypothetical protein
LLQLSLFTGGISGKQFLDCTFKTYSEVENLWPEHNRCHLKNVDLSGEHNETFEFSGTKKEKIETKTLWFMWEKKELPVEYTNEVDFVPPEIFQEFPSLTGLGIQYHKIPVLKNCFFSSEFRKLEYLFLGGTEIAEIESEAFQELVNLKWVKLWNNKIKAINYPIFKFNSKLIYISFATNEISKLNPTIFDGISGLKKLDFRYYNCYTAELEAKDGSLTRCELDKAFSKCFENCRSDPDCSAEIIETDSQILKRILNELADLKKEATAKQIGAEIEALRTQLSTKMEENAAELKSLKLANDNLLKRFEDFENIVINSAK